MKPIFRPLAVAIATAVGFTAAAQSFARPVVVVSIPFAFHAGRYEIAEASPGRGLAPRSAAAFVMPESRPEKEHARVGIAGPDQVILAGE